ncbi:unnamed protein product [Alopecurus aequalis]
MQMSQTQQHADDYNGVPAQAYSILSVNTTLTSAHLTNPAEASNGDRVEAACSLAMLQTAPSNGELILTTLTIGQHETITNMRKDRNQIRRERDRAWRNSLTAEKRKEMNACRRAAMEKKTIDERNVCQRQRRRNLPANKRQEMNARRRERWQNIPPKVKQTLLAQRNARLADRRNTPCVESIAMPCPYAVTLPSTSWN